MSVCAARGSTSYCHHGGCRSLPGGGGRPFRTASRDIAAVFLFQLNKLVVRDLKKTSDCFTSNPDEFSLQEPERTV